MKTIYGVRALASTEKAVCVLFYEGTKWYRAWFPKSVIKIASGVMVLPKYIYNQKINQIENDSRYNDLGRGHQRAK